MLQYTRNQRIPMLEYEDKDCVEKQMGSDYNCFIIQECLLCDSIDKFLTEKCIFVDLERLFFLHYEK